MAKKTRKKESLFIQAARKMIEKKDGKFEDWKREIISTRKLAILEGKDAEWEISVIEEESQKLVAEEIIGDQALDKQGSVVSSGLGEEIKSYNNG